MLLSKICTLRPRSTQSVIKQKCFQAASHAGESASDPVSSAASHHPTPNATHGKSRRPLTIHGHPNMRHAINPRKPHPSVCLIGHSGPSAAEVNNGGQQQHGLLRSGDALRSGSICRAGTTTGNDHPSTDARSPMAILRSVPHPEFVTSGLALGPLWHVHAVLASRLSHQRTPRRIIDIGGKRRGGAWGRSPISRPALTDPPLRL